MKGSSMPRFAAALVVMTMLLAAPSVGQAQTTPSPTLDGEFFADPVPTVNATCNPDGASTITFEASGVATGPFTGTFTETGTATVGPQTPPSTDIVGTGTLTSFEAEFTIHSLTGEVVTGSKELLAEVELGGTCQDEVRSIRLINITEGVSYTAAIETPEGERFVDRGSATVEVVEAEPSDPLPSLSTFFEAFQSEPLPTTREECQRGGFENFDFENQGDCVSFVVTGGKNEPGKNQK